MASDIVERLRSYASDDHERLCQGRYYNCSCGYDGKRDPLMTEAAAEIARLRAALRETVAWADRHGKDPDWLDAARRALAQDKQDG